MFPFYRKAVINRKIHDLSVDGIYASTTIVYILVFAGPLIWAAVRANNGFDSEVDWYVLLATLSTPTMVILFFAIHAIDAIIAWHVSIITSGKRKLENFISSKLFKPCEMPERPSNRRHYRSLHYYDEASDLNKDVGMTALNFNCMVLPFTVVSGIIFMVCAQPWIVWLFVVVGVWASLIYIARKVFGVSERLVDHANDPDAHNESGKN